MAQNIDQAGAARNTSTNKNDLPQETTGMVTSDSLAAESLNRSGDFAQGQAVPASVPSYATTTNTTDTSGATILPPVADGTERPIDIHDYTHTAPPQQPSGSSGSGAYDTSKGGPQAADGGAAPTYVGSVTRNFQDQDELTPKGRNLTEGGFDPDAPNASFTTDIGGKNDPGRVALDTVEKANAKSGNDVAYEGANEPVGARGDKGGFEVLGDEQA